MRRDELPAGWRPDRDSTLTIWECVQHTARTLAAEDGGRTAAARLVGLMGAKALDALALAHRLYEIANTGLHNPAEARVYAELATEWSMLEDEADGMRDDTRTDQPPVQGSLL